MAFFGLRVHRIYTERSRPRWRRSAGWCALAGALAALAGASDRLPRYYAHETVEDGHGVIAPWWGRQNGGLDERLRIAIELHKRYPWASGDQAVMPAPHIVYNTHWKIADDGTISIPPTDPWMCGDLSQRALSIIQGLTAYYRYSGDPIAFAYVPITADSFGYVDEVRLAIPGRMVTEPE